MPDVRRTHWQYRADGQSRRTADPRVDFRRHGRARRRHGRRRRGAVLVSSLADRLRAIVPAGTPPKAASLVARGATNAADVLGGEWCGDYLVVERTYSPGYRHGRTALADAAPPIEGWNRLGVLGGGASPCLFLDLETTGLAGGAGTYAFLVGLAWFDGCSFRVRQFFLANLAAERVLLEALRAVAADIGEVLSYNGKSFDLPLLETRYV